MKKSELKNLIREIINEQIIDAPMGGPNPTSISNPVRPDWSCCEKIDYSFNKVKTIILGDGGSDELVGQIHDILRVIKDSCCHRNILTRPNI